jgi:hypothetical protein
MASINFGEAILALPILCFNNDAVSFVVSILSESYLKGILFFCD